MDDRSPRAPRTHQGLRIGHRLVNGPTALYPPASADDMETLTPVLRLAYSSAGLVESESVIVFTGDRLNPKSDRTSAVVIRYAHWLYGQDRHTFPSWPTVNVRLGRVEPPLNRLDSCIRSLHIAVQRLPFVTLGLPINAVAPELLGDSSMGVFSILVSNYAQTVEFTSQGIRDDGLRKLFTTSFALLKSMMRAFPREGWLESYPFDLSNDLLHKRWKWDGQIPTRSARPQKAE